MRITCQKCAAAYAIDDRAISPKGVRAQCPRCRHLQLVRRDAVPPPLPSAPPAPPSITPVSLDSLPAVMPPPLPSAPPHITPLEPLSTPPPMEASLELDAAPDVRHELFELDSSKPLRPPTAEAELGTANQEHLAPRNVCRSCGKALEDPFDLALGVCDACRANPGPVAEPRYGAAPGPAAHDDDVVTSSNDVPSFPDPADTRPLRDSGAIRLPSAPVPGPVRSASASDDAAPLGLGKLLALGFVLVLVAGGAVLLVKRPWVPKKAPTLAQKVVVTPSERVATEWRNSLRDDVGTDADVHLQEGQRWLALDTSAGYEAAELEFKKAFVLSPKSPVAVAGYVSAVALGRAEAIDDRTFETARSLVTDMEARFGRQPGLLVAHANLLLCRPTQGNLNDARALAEAALTDGTPAERAMAHVALGQSYRTTNGLQAIASFEQALQLDPTLRRGYYYRSLASQAVGDYRAAADFMEKRLRLDPDQAEVVEALARLYLAVGETGRARSTLDDAVAALPDAVRPRLLRAMFAYQHDGRAREAVGALEGLARGGIASANPALAAEVLGHLAAARRLSGAPDEALDAAHEALALAPDEPNAHLQAFWVLANRQEAVLAKEHLTAVQAKLVDAALVKMLEGHLHFAGGRWEEAAAAFVKAHELDVRRTDGLLMAGASFARARSAAKAYEVVFRDALKGDPERGGPRKLLAREFTSTADLLGPAKAAFAALPKEGEDPNPPLCQALVQWHLGDRAGALKAFTHVSAIDPGNAYAFAYRALIVLEQRQLPAALRLGEQAADAGKQVALAHYAHGQALLASRKYEAAKRAYQLAIKLDPKLLGPRVGTGTLEFQFHDAAEARKVLTSVLGIDPTFHEAARALYLGGQPR